MEFTSVLLTGVAGGIGQALAIACAAPGRTLHLCDRDPAGLEVTAAACRAKGANAVPTTLDVTDAGAVEGWVKSCDALDLVITCAGVMFTSLVGEAETATEVRRTLDVNLNGTLNVVLPALEMMAAQPEREPGLRGRIAVMSSLGVFVTVPGASAYCASKAALDSFIVGRAALARGQGIWLTSICPGYVRTNMTAINGYAMHGLMEPDYVARTILKRLEARPTRLAFPWRMVWAAKLGGLLPAGFPARMLARNYAKRKARNG